MSSTSNAQDLLVNVFRPTYRWDPTTGFIPSLVVSNVTEVITDSIKTGKFAVSDANANTYIGCNAGPLPTNLTTSSNTAIGASAMAGASNSSNNVSIGTSNFASLLNSTSNVGVGSETYITGSGSKNILLGANLTLGDGSGNILIGTDLSVGSVTNHFQLGRILYGDLSAGYVGINTSAPEAPLDISGEVIFRNKVGIQMLNPAYTLDVAGTAYAYRVYALGIGGYADVPSFSFCNASNVGMYLEDFSTLGFASCNGRAMTLGATKATIYRSLDVCGTISSSGGSASFLAASGTATEPAYSFTGASNLGLYRTTDSSGAAVAIAVGGQNRLVVGSNTMTMIGNLNVSGTFTATSGGGGGGGGTIASNGLVSAPSFTFSNDASSGVYLQSVSNLGFATAGVNRMSILNTGDVSADRLVVSTYLRNTTNGTRTLDISGGNISNSGLHTTAGLVGTYVRNALTPTTYDISGGNISNSGLHTTSGLVGTYLRNALTPTTYDISGGAISNSGTTRSSNFIGTAAASNSIGGVTLSNNTISNGATTSNSIGGVMLSNGVLSNGATTVNSIGGISLSNGVLSNGATTNNSIGGIMLSNGVLSNGATTSNSIGGVTLSNGTLGTSGTTTSANLIASGYLRNALTPTQFDISGGNLSNSGLHTTTGLVGTYLRNALTPTTYDISGGNISNSGTTTSANALVSGYLRNALTPTQFDISGGSISNLGTTTSSNFFGSATASNSIGGVTLSNGTISNYAEGSNSIGGVTLSNGAVSSVYAASNVIGGVELSFGGVTTVFGANNNIGGITMSYGVLSNSSNTRNSIGGVDLSHGTLRTSSTARSTIGGFDLSAGSIYGSSITSNSIGGIDLCAGAIYGSPTSTNFIGGTRLSNGSLCNAGTTQSSTFFAGRGTAAEPSLTFWDVSGTGIYQVQDETYGTGAIGITMNQSPRIIVGSSTTYILGNLDVCGNFSATTGGGGGGGGGSGTIASNGTAAAPSFTFTNDSSTGLYLKSFNTLGMSTGGVNRLTISSTGDVSMTQMTVSNYIRGPVVDGLRTLDISGGNITFGGQILGTSGALSNSIGGVTLSNGTVDAAVAFFGGTLSIDAGAIVSYDSTTSNSIGGITLSNGVLSNSSTGSNSIGGVTLSNGIIGNGSTTSNSIGGIDLSSGEIYNAYLTSNRIGGVDLSHGRIVTDTAAAPSYINGVVLGSSTISNLATGSNSIGGVTLSNGLVTASNVESTYYITSNTTLSWPAGYSKANVTLVGAGGGGGSSYSGYGGGGGGGSGYILQHLLLGAQTLDIIVGTGGTGGDTGGDGSDGGATTLQYGSSALLLTAPGGKAGRGYYEGGRGGAGAYGGGGGTGPGGVGKLIDGGDYIEPSPGDGGGCDNGGGAYGGGGGGGGQGGFGGSPGAGSAGGPGCGGGGGDGGTTSGAGGAGGNGYCIVRFLP